MAHPVQSRFQCQCGAVQGTVTHLERAHRVTCYCGDCQAFAHFLGNSSSILDSQGGTDIAQTAPHHLTFLQGQEHLGCMRLTETGLLRWYTTCCKTPIGNTLASSQLSFIGLVHNCLEQSGEDLTALVGTTRTQVHTDSAQGEPKPKAFGLLPMMARNIWGLVKHRLDGSYRDNPLFDAESGEAIAAPQVLAPEEYNRLLEKIGP